ncbi:hypothetical protein MNEG_4946 [Monoraphidium neglectum]|uniref:Rab-GAP TBC domain-containing protein n=1 Tax=Monoraphidium neglectum TaxID=145388 RepID=A0A0D2MJ21_9CHLO|nr:hypothetical protein MNEG_4946 [Monoraphidium neglectum]KIZ03010.1 hypothetical protein MNEG_4946 [Monoraphidium neglectum]|eukprot:XP_013902029.1 hypothetical protein MNEG_4946 [Monoraphidium neglectum]
MACSQSSPFPSPTQDPSPTPPPSATASRHTPIVQVGLDDVLHPWFREQQISQAQRVLASASSAACARAARTGLPPSARPAAWACALGLPPQPPQPQPEAAGVARPAAGCYLASRRDEDVLRVLCEGVERQQLLVDALTCGDTAAVAASEHYFLFADAIRRAGCTQGYGLEPAPHDCRPAILLAFSRDASICRNARGAPLPRLAMEGRGGRLHAYPPSGVLPFCGLAALAAPLAFLYSSPAAAYRVFAALYCRHWMFSAFAGYLSPGETLLLWDRVIGFDSLLPLPLLAVAVVTRDLILAAASPEELTEAVEDLGEIRVVPLLQALLFDA